ncbi:hypothetical protein GH5_06970 [Leishmania sp. Ghana 2012 LV757]|uniref:hypothetical protein n=1 Tax=Leishmania sp. Ghana 2012 LV757 TaxID=2803181 RepID=UPI001B6E6C6B|nr:hypothetical protein GH5_06970 [Leishmania sp. Ghana 2012 LV757]
MSVMKGPTRLPNTSPLPALMAAVELFEDKRLTVSSPRPVPPHLLHTFTGCIYEVASLQKGNASEATSEPLSQRHVSHITTAITTEAAVLRSSSDSDTKGSCEHAPAAEAGVASSPTSESTCLSTTASYPPISIRFVCPIPYSQLNQFDNLVHVLSTALRQVAPHCVYGLPSSSDMGLTSTAAKPLSSVGLCIPAEVTPRERAAAVAFAADLSVRAFQPVVEGLLQRSCSTLQQESVLLLPRIDTAVETTGSQRVVDTEAIFSASALFVTATPTPAALAPTDTRSPTGAGSVPFYAGTVSLTVCISTDDEGDAARIRRYLTAFTEVGRAPVLLLVRESPEPPLGVSAAPDWTVKAEHSHVWWCSFVFAPHQITSAASLRRGLRWARELRPTVLFHVHQERMAMHAQLRQQLRKYVGHFH